MQRARSLSRPPVQAPSVLNSVGMRGFTLIEVMVAIALMAVIAAVSWRGIDALLRAQAYTQRQATEQAVVQTTLMQWQTDLDQMSNVLALTPMDWDGKVFRLTRTSPRVSATDTPTLVVVAWSDRLVNGQRHWLRWQSQPVFNRAQWREAWAAAQLWSQGQGGSSTGQEIALLPLVQWQLYYARDRHWVNPLSSDGTPPATPPTEGAQHVAADAFFALPDGVRLQIELPPNSPLGGTITRDWLVPTFGAVR